MICGVVIADEAGNNNTVRTCFETPVVSQASMRRNFPE
jgi:hypothetical protein